MKSFVSGIVESPPPLQCDNSINHGIENVEIEIIKKGFEVGAPPEIMCTTMTDAAGNYDCTILDMVNATVSASKADGTFCGIESNDLVMVHDHIIGVDFLDHPYEYFAADANGDGVITVLDNQVIQAIINEDFQTALNMGFRGWDFMPATYYANLQDPVPPPGFQPGGFPYAISIPSTPLGLFLSKDFTGIKIADLNASCTNCNGFTGDEIDDRSKNLETESIEFPNISLEKSEETMLVFDCKNKPALNFFQISLLFEEDYLDIVSVESALQMGSFMQYFPENESGKLNANWLGNEAIPVNDDLFYLNVRAKKAIANIADYLSLEETSHWIEQEGKVQKSLILKEIEQAETAMLFPNPLQENSKIQFYHSSSGSVRLTIFDQEGRKLSELAAYLDKGWQEYALSNISDYSAGIYFFQLQTNTHIHRGKFIKTN